MRLMDFIDAIERCASIHELRRELHAAVQNLGFANFAFLDLGRPGIDDPFVVATTDAGWDRDYRSNGFFHVDPVLPKVRRVNRPFAWADVRLPLQLGRRKSGARKTMEAAREHGLREGFVVPIHYVDNIGRGSTASCVLFWKDDVRSFRLLSRERRFELHTMLLYWSQRVLELRARGYLAEPNAMHGPENAVNLTDRERAVLEWAARGKTMAETAVILAISADTVEDYARSAIRKFSASNKTQAVVLAIKYGLIDL